MNWQPISTAPQDQDIIISVPGGFVGQAYLKYEENEEWVWYWHTEAKLHENYLPPFGWMPLPPPLEGPVQ